MKKDFYRFIYAVLLKLTNRFPNKLLIRYKLLFGTLLLGATAATTAKAAVQKPPADLPAAHYMDPSHTISITGIHKTDTTRHVIKGRVMDAKDGTPIRGCEIYVKGTTNGTVPDEEGNFTLTVTGKDRQIVIKYLGYQTATVQIEPVMEVFLEEDEQILCYETVVVYYEKKKIKKEKKNKNILEIKGKVTDTYNEEIIGASIILNSTGESLTTDLDGQFSLVIPINKKEETTITVSCLGFVTQTIPVQPNMQIILEEDDQVLECYITVTGFGATKKRIIDQDHPAAVQTIRGRVTDEDGEPVIGAKIEVKGTAFKTDADQNGQFTLTLPGDIGEVSVRYIGFLPQTVTLQPDMQIILVEDDSLLESVVPDYPAGKRQLEFIHGFVTDEEGDPVVGARINIEGTTCEAFTDGDGKYFLRVPEDTQEFSVGYIGFESQTISVYSTNNIIRLKEKSLDDQMVIMCYTTIDKKTIRKIEKQQKKEEKANKKK